MKPLKGLLLLLKELLLLAAQPILILALLILPSRIVRRAYDWIDGAAR
jgi:hypothetical protein